MAVDEQSREFVPLFPGTGFRSVWSIEDGDAVHIAIKPIDFLIGVNIKKRRSGKWFHDYSDVVALELLEGIFEVVTDVQNCHGTVRDNATWEECLALLPGDLQARVVAPTNEVSEDQCA